MLNSELPLFASQSGKEKASRKQKTFDNDATSTILGFEYQKLIAIHICLESARNETIYLECFGDVAKDKKETLEIKHHTRKTNLRDTSVDFWKTLHNFVKEEELVRQFSRLILHTTAYVQENSIFSCWNDLSADKKLAALREVKSNKTIKKMHSQVFGTDEQILLDILSKFSIKSSQPDIQAKMEELKMLPVMKIIPERYRQKVLKDLIGYVTGRAIDNRYKWQIESNTFDLDFRFMVRPYVQEDVAFPIVTKDEIDIERRDFRFVAEIKKIEYERMISFAVADYLRAGKSRIKLLENAPIIRNNLDLFDNELTDTLLKRKISHCDGLSSEIVNSTDAHKESRRLYDSCTDMPKQAIQGVQEIEMYFQNGRIHSIVEEETFVWHLEESDFESH
jgi:hypothetical protein